MATLLGPHAARAVDDPDHGGWRVNRHLAIEGLVIGPLQSSGWHGDSDHPDRQAFNLMAGVRAVGYLPLVGPWDAMAGVGDVGTVRQQDVRGGATPHVPLIGLRLEQRS